MTVLFHAFVGVVLVVTRLLELTGMWIGEVVEEVHYTPVLSKRQ